jgi:TPR repeat protein
MLSGGGYEVPMDRASQRWLRAAAEQGHAEAQRILGRYLARGAAGDRDPDCVCG